MPKPRDPNRDKAFEIFKEHNGNITNRQIAEMLDEKENTISAWKCREKWSVVLQKNECSTTNEKMTSLLYKNKPKEVKKRAAEVVASNEELSEKQQLFCQLYAQTCNATQSYLKAFGVSYNAASVEGHKLLRKPKIRDEVQRLKKERFDAILFNEHDIFQWYLDIATASVTDFLTFGREEVPVMSMVGPVIDKESGELMTKEVNYIKFKESDEVDGRLIKKVKLGKDGASIELYDAEKAMNWLTDHLYMGTSEQQSLAQSIQGAYEKRMQGGNDHDPNS